MAAKANDCSEKFSRNPLSSVTLSFSPTQKSFLNRLSSGWTWILVSFYWEIILWQDTWRVSQLVFNLIHLSFLTGTPKLYFLQKDKLAIFSLLTATDPVIHIQLPLSYLGQVLGDLWSSEILPLTFPVVLSDEKKLNWAPKFRFCRSCLN